MNLSFEEFFSEDIQDTEFSTYEYKLENRKTETEALSPYYRAITSKRVSVLGFPYQYAFEKNLYKITGKPIDAYFAESLNPRVKDPKAVRLEYAKNFVKECPGSQVYFPTVMKGDEFVAVANSRMKEVIGQIPLIRNDKFIEDTPIFVPVRQKKRYGNVSDLKGTRTAITRRAITRKFNQFDIIDLDYVTAPHMENLYEVYSMWRKLKPNGILLVTFALQHTRGRTNLESSREQTYKELSEPYKIKNLQNTFPNNPHFKLNTQGIRQYGLFKRKMSVLTQSQNVLNNVIDRLSKTRMPAPVYTNIYLGGEGNSTSTIMGRIAWVK